MPDIMQGESNPSRQCNSPSYWSLHHGRINRVYVLNVSKKLKSKSFIVFIQWVKSKPHSKTIKHIRVHRGLARVANTHACMHTHAHSRRVVSLSPTSPFTYANFCGVNDLHKVFRFAFLKTHMKENTHIPKITWLGEGGLGTKVNMLRWGRKY